MQEKNIMDAIKSGDEQEMQKIICRYSRLLWSIVGAVLSQVGTTEDMEECVADVFIDLWEHPQEYDESRGNLKAWLSVIARNKAIDRYRQKTKIQTIPLEETVLAQEMGVEPEMEKKRGASGSFGRVDGRREGNPAAAVCLPAKAQGNGGGIGVVCQTDRKSALPY